MNSLDIRRLSADGYVIAVEPPLAREERKESMRVTFGNERDVAIRAISGVEMVKVYHNRIVVIFCNGGFDEYIFKHVFRSGKGDVLIESTNQKDAWYLKYSTSLTGLVRYIVSDAGTSNERWQDQEAVIFTGIDHGFEEVLYLEAKNDKLDLYDLIPQYKSHYDRLLGTDRE